MNKQRIVSLLLVFALFIPVAAFANEPDGCPQLGIPITGTPGPYDYIANGMPYYNSCWYLFNTTFTTDYDGCGTYRNMWEFNYGGSLTQTLVIPEDRGGTHLTLYYQLDFDDPNHDGAWNRFTATVTDNSNNGRQLGSEFYSGAYPSLFCSNRKIVMTSPVDLAGHTITVRFTGSRAYNNTHIRLKAIRLLRQ